MPPSSDPKLYGARLTPHQVGAIRYQVVRLVERALAEMQAVLDGTRQASPQQVALFLKVLSKALPRARDAPSAEPEKRDTSWVRSLSVADLQRLLSETLGEAPPAPASPPAPTKAELAAERERHYQQDYERRHPELRQRRAEANAKRYASMKELGARIKARKAAEPPEEPWTREQDDAARSAMRARLQRRSGGRRSARPAGRWRSWAPKTGIGAAKTGMRPVGTGAKTGTSVHVRKGGKAGEEWLCKALDVCLGGPIGAAALQLGNTGLARAIAPL